MAFTTVQRFQYRCDMPRCANVEEMPVSAGNMMLPKGWVGMWYRVGVDPRGLRYKHFCSIVHLAEWLSVMQIEPWKGL